MSKIFIGLIVFFCVIALIFSYASNFDYTYDENADFSADFKESVDINSGMFKTSFHSVFDTLDTVISFVQKSFNSILYALDSSHRYTSEEWEKFFEQLYERSYNYCKENSNFFNRAICFEYLEKFYQELSMSVKYSDYVPGNIMQGVTFANDSWWQDWYKDFNWSDSDLLKIHQYLTSLNIPHMLYGQKYCFGDEET